MSMARRGFRGEGVIPLCNAGPLNLANAGGLHAAEARLVHSNGVPVALIRRFDRTSRGGRIPYVYAATLLGSICRRFRAF